MKKIIIPGLIAGAVVFIISYGSIYLGIKLFPSLFLGYNNPLFNSENDRDILFYLHAFIISFALSWFWERFKGLFKGAPVIRGLEFGGVYTVVSLLPIMWLTFSAMDVTLSMVFSWMLYGFVQAVIAGVTFAKINP
ncbi:hypothetical protein ACSBL2_18240 [Pedobacter sp. AW31-3R]|uniref:hypothetical protein n=1 Tax=Pedobacter sp. AW31-3R TaxID=3445781 RepID=UPI003FA0187D